MYIRMCMCTGAILLARWMRPCHCPAPSIMTSQLDCITEKVAKELMQRAEEGEGEGEGKGLKKERTSSKQPRPSLLEAVKRREFPVDSKLSAINTVLYEQLGFHGASVHNYYTLDNSYLDKVQYVHVHVYMYIYM